VATHRYRLRLLNASTFQSYNFSLSDHRAFLQVGTGNGLLPKPVKRSSILLGPAQRVDVVVDFTGELHKKVVLRSIPRKGHPPRGSAASPSVPIMQFRVRTKVADGNKVPTTLEQPPAITVPSTGSFTWKLGGSGKSWTINGHGYNPKTYDVAVPFDSTQTWTIVNNTKMTHFVHLHEEQWHTISRDKKPPPPWERGLEDTWRLDPGESVVVRANFTDYSGVFMIHCHMLNHEDDGMMAQWVVRNPDGSIPGGLRLATAANSPVAMDMAMSMPRMHMGGMHTSGTHVVAAQAVPVHTAFWPRALQRAAVALAVEVGALLLLWLLLGYRRRFDNF
jgi:FtsP/CotA-like multicopper oxidase with cupredoxin domain